MAYFRLIWSFHRGLLLFATAIISLVQFLILRVYTSFDTRTLISGMLEQMPENVKKMLGEEFLSMLTVEGTAAFGFNHPIVLVILSITAILIPSRHIAGEAETGTLELLLSYPIKRTHLLVNLFVSTIAILFLIILFALGVSLLSLGLFHHLTVDTAVKLGEIAFNLWLLFVFIASLTMVLSSFGKEDNKVAIRVAGIILVFYLLHYISSLWDAIRVTKPLNIFSYYQPTGLMSGERSLLLHFAVLSILILVCLTVSVLQFQRRDIPG